MQGRGNVFLVAVLIIGTLAAFTMVPSLRQRIPIPPGEEPKRPKSAEAYHGGLPAGFSITGSLSGQEAPPTGFTLPNSTIIKVRNRSASGEGRRVVELLWGTERLTGEETYSFDGRLDRASNKLTGDVVWALRGRAGQRLIDWRFTGTYSGRFTSSTSVRGKITGVALDEERYASSQAAPRTTRTTPSWKHDGLRGK